MKKCSSAVFSLLVLSGGAAFAGEPSHNYLVLAKSQGKGSADLDGLMARAGATITGRIPEIGVVLATSANPDFLTIINADARVQQAAEDIEVAGSPTSMPSSPPKPTSRPAASMPNPIMRPTNGTSARSKPTRRPSTGTGAGV